MPDEQGNTPDLRPGIIARAAIPQRLDQLEDALNETAKRAVGALAEAAMARQETAAQSQRIDRATEDGQNAALRLSERIAGLNRAHQEYVTNADTSMTAMMARLDAHESDRSDMVRIHAEFSNRFAALEDAIKDLPAPKLAVSNVQFTRLKVNFYDRAGKLLDWVVPGNHVGEPFFPSQEMLARTHSISVEYSRG